MLILISPSKKLNCRPSPGEMKVTLPALLKKSEVLIDILKKMSRSEISSLMKLSDQLADVNYNRYKEFSIPFTEENARAAILAFKGDVYDGLKAEEFSGEDLNFAQTHLRILSGLYGILRPRDLIMPYRLEMGTSLNNPEGKNLYSFWKKTLTSQVNAELESKNNLNKVVVNLASNEYFKAIDKNKVKGKIVTIDFKENKNGKLKTIMIYAKRARGMMAGYVIKNKLQDVDSIKKFSEGGYSYNHELSDDNRFVFVR